MITPLGVARLFARLYRGIRLRLLLHEESWQKTGNGFYMKIRRSDFMSRAMLFGYYEASLVYWIKHMIPSDSTVIDIGANHGYFTLLLAKMVGNNGRVISVEPDPQAIEALRSNVEYNELENISLNPFVLSNSAGKCDFFVSRQSGFSSRFPNDIAKPTISHAISVEMKTLDCLLEELDILPSTSNIPFVKIDAEGSEPFILEGMSRTLSLFGPVIWFEVNRGSLQSADRNLDFIETIFRNAGYSLFRPIWQRDRLLLRGSLKLLRLSGLELVDSCFDVLALIETPELVDKMEQSRIIVEDRISSRQI